MEWIAVVDKALPIVGVIIGALLAPYITYKMEANKVKGSLKATLAEVVHKYFNYRKNFLRDSNHSKLIERGIEIAWKQSQTEGLTPDEKAEHLKRYEGLVLESDNMQKSSMNEDEKLVLVESQIIWTILLIKTHFGEKEHTRIDNLITPHIDSTVEPEYLMDFKTIPQLEWNKSHDKLNDLLRSKKKELDETRKRIINRLLN